MKKHLFKFPIYFFFLFSFLLSSDFIQAQIYRLDVENGISADNLLLRNLPAFRAELTAEFDIVPTPYTLTPIMNLWFDSNIAGHQTLFDNGNNFNHTTGKFTAIRAGIYYFRVEWIFKGGHLFDDVIHSYISVNGSITDRCIKGYFTLLSGGNTNSTPESARLTRSFGGILKLDAGDMVNVQIEYLNDEINGPGFGQFVIDPYTSFSGYLITDLE